MQMSGLPKAPFRYRYVDGRYIFDEGFTAIDLELLRQQPLSEEVS